jgi:hypothetical protein
MSEPAQDTVRVSAPVPTSAGVLQPVPVPLTKPMQANDGQEHKPNPAFLAQFEALNNSSPFEDAALVSMNDIKELQDIFSGGGSTLSSVARPPTQASTLTQARPVLPTQVVSHVGGHALQSQHQSQSPPRHMPFSPPPALVSSIAAQISASPALASFVQPAASTIQQPPTAGFWRSSQPETANAAMACSRSTSPPPPVPREPKPEVLGSLSIALSSIAVRFVPCHVFRDSTVLFGGLLNHEPWHLSWCSMQSRSVACVQKGLMSSRYDSQLICAHPQTWPRFATHHGLWVTVTSGHSHSLLLLCCT